MIAASHNFAADFIYRLYIRRLLKKHFYAFHLFGSPPILEDDRPVLLLPNHSTWWDGFLADFLNREFFQKKFFLMMLEEELRKNRFFARLGAYSIAPGRPKSVVRSLGYTVSLLQDLPDSVICIFPQGELQPWGVHPLSYKSGIEWIIKKCGRPIRILLVGMRAEFRFEQRPEVFFLFNSPTLLPAEKVSLASLQQMHAHVLQELDERVKKGEKGKIILRGNPSINKKLNSLTTKLNSRRGKN